MSGDGTSGGSFGRSDTDSRPYTTNANNPGSDARHMPLRRVVGGMTIVCTGVGGAIGSGVFRTPGAIAEIVGSPWVILLLWLAAGLITLMQSLVTAELATRFPKAGGEYQYLKEAYGPFAAFFFGWAFTVFIIGCGSGTIAAAFGDFAVELFHLKSDRASATFGVAAIAFVVTVNALGLRTGAITQNALTILKTAALLGIGIGAMIVAGRWVPIDAAVSDTGQSQPPSTGNSLTFATCMAALLLAFWPFTGATDPAKLSEETRDVRRSLPRALVATVGVLTLVYLLYNYALLCAMSPSDMAGRSDAHATVFRDVSGVPIRPLILIASMLICLGSISAVFLANTRVTFALARDGLIFGRLAWMSRHQAPVPSLFVCGAIACVFVWNRKFQDIIQIYFMGAAPLFGLSYLSLIVFRVRDLRAGRPFHATAFRAPWGVPIALVLVILQGAIAVGLLMSDIQSWRLPPDERRYDSLLCAALLAALAALYFIWTRLSPGARQDGR